MRQPILDREPAHGLDLVDASIASPKSVTRASHTLATLSSTTKRGRPIVRTGTSAETAYFWNSWNLLVLVGEPALARPTPSGRPGTAVAALDRMAHCFATIALLTLWACEASDSTPPADSSALPDPTLPVLPGGNHLGLWPTYDVLPVGTAAAADARLQEARSAGMRVARVHVGWNELEPSRNTFELDDLRAALTAASNDGYAIHLLIESIDSDGFSIPSDLADPDAPYGLRDGLRFDDPTILARFGALLDRVLPMLDEHRVFAISVGNEPDNLLDDVPPLSPEGLAWIAENARFLTAARARIQARFPAIAVAMTVAQGSLQKGVTTLGPLIEAGDVAVFNYYCQDRDFQVKPPTVIREELDELQQLAGGRPVIIQELGCPAGATAGSVIGASEAKQAEFFAEVGRQMVNRPQLRAAFGFQLVDWSPELVNLITDALRDEGLSELADRYGETLASIGLVRFGNGSPRPAWNTFVDAIRKLSP